MSSILSPFTKIVYCPNCGEKNFCQVYPAYTGRMIISAIPLPLMMLNNLYFKNNQTVTCRKCQKRFVFNAKKGTIKMIK